MSLGLGAMIWQLGGGSSKSASDYYGKRIQNAEFKNEALFLDFESGEKIRISDEGQSCCEHRYMTTDDSVDFLKGKVLTDITLKAGPDANEDDYGVHEQQFMEVMTDAGCITFCSHNEHNGYYGGICVSITEV